MDSGPGFAPCGWRAVWCWAEAGVPGLDATYYEPVWAPRAMPAAKIDRLQQEIAKALGNLETRARLAATDLDPVGSTPAEASRSAKADHDKWGVVQRKINLMLD